MARSTYIYTLEVQKKPSVEDKKNKIESRWYVFGNYTVKYEAEADQDQEEEKGYNTKLSRSRDGRSKTKKEITLLTE